MTLLTISQAACYAVPIAAPSSIVGNTSDQTAQLILALANEAGNSLTRRNPAGWVSMIREYDFSTVSYGPIEGAVANVGGYATVTTVGSAGAGIAAYGWVLSGPSLYNNAIITNVASGGGFYVYTTNLPMSDDATTGNFYFSKTDYPLPSDYERSVDQTMWDRTRYWQMRGVLSPQQWQFYRSSIFGKTTVQRRYRFRNSDWLSTATGTPSINIFSIDPVPVDNGANLVFEYVSNGWCASATTNARQSQWLADSDYGVIDEYLMTLGLKWRLLRRMGVSYDAELDEYEREVDKAVARDGGTAVLDMTPTWGNGLLTPFNTQEGNFPATPNNAG